jgi:RecA/RadA recombinase
LLIEKKRKGVEIPKIMFVMDSLGNLATQKEIDDASSGSEKADMTRAKVIKSIFRIITTKLGEIHAPLVITNHTYQSQGFISQTVGAGGEGLKYAASIILNLSKAQLKEGDSKTGIIVTAKSVKNRFAKPLQEIKFQISFSKGMNPYIGLHNYVSWETCGIGEGKILNQKDFLKKYDAEDGEEFELNGEKLYFVKDEGKEFAIKHLGRTVKNHEFFTPAVFTNEILKQLDDKVIKEIFEFGDSYEDDIDNILDDSDDSEF